MNFFKFPIPNVLHPPMPGIASFILLFLWVYFNSPTLLMIHMVMY